MNRYVSLIGRQAGKVTFTSLWKGSDIIGALKNGVVTVNSNAQRTLAKGANTTPTHKLVDQDKVHETPRMKELVSFLNRVMDKVEAADVSEGFLGAVLMVVPEDFTDARWLPLDGEKVDLEVRNRVGVLVVEEAGLDRPAFHIGDGQGRFFGLYSMEFVAKKNRDAKAKEIDRLRKAKKDVRELEKQLVALETFVKRVQKFIREMQITVVCYAKTFRDDGTVIGLDVKAQRRLFVEGNALNSRASKEAQLRFDSVSPANSALYELRVAPEVYFWMDPDYIEENSKSIAKGSNKLFTLSTLSQAYGWSVANTTKIQRLDPDMYEMVGTRREFVEAYWRKVTEVFAPLWRRGEDTPDGDWLDYLSRRRTEQNVAIQAVFLQALGRFGYNLGKLASWKPEATKWLDRVDALTPMVPLDVKPANGEPAAAKGKVDYRAFRGRLGDAGKDGKKELIQVISDLATDFDSRWTNALMKARTGKDDKGKSPNTAVGFTFNNVRDSVIKTYRVLLELAGLEDTAEAAEEADESTADEVVEADAF